MSARFLCAVLLGAMIGTCLRECPARADVGSDVAQLVRELAGIRRAIEAGKCGGR